MSIFTTEVRFICESFAGYEESVGFQKISDVIAAARPKIFDFYYPIFEESYRSVLETKILTAFYTREICEETVGLWKLRLEQKLNEIMPYYNQLYKSQMLKFDPLLSDNYKRSGSRDGNLNRDSAENMGDETVSNRNANTTTENKRVLNWNDTAGTVATGKTTGKTGSQTNVEGNDSSKTVGEAKSQTDSEGTRTNTQSNAYQDTPQGALTDVTKLKYLTDYRLINDNEKTTGKVIGSENSTNTTTGDSKSTTIGSGDSEENRSDTTNTSRSGSQNETHQGSTHTEEDAKQNYSRERNESTEQKTNENFWETIIGYQGRSASTLLMEFRETFLNIDQEVLKELEPLFFGLWF